MLCAIGFALALLPNQTAAADAAVGNIEGRVFNPINGANLENARLSVEGTGFETFTNDGGRYRLVAVPTGTVQIRAFFTGLEVSRTTVTVAAGSTVQHDIRLSSQAEPVRKDDRPIVLDKYLVVETQQMEGSAIAINEQRFAPNLKTVVAADEFGAASEGDVGEFLKYLPGVTMDYLAGDARQVSLGGVDFDHTPITFGGFGMTNGNQGGTNRGVSLEYVSLNNVSRVEVINSPTPESSGSALAGSINFVPRTAFERTKPQYTATTYLSMRDDLRDFHRSVGPRENPTRKVRPGFEFSAVVPVSHRFGFSVSGTVFNQYSARDSFVNVWRGANAVTNGGTFPDTTPDRPYLSNFTFRDGFLNRMRTSVAFTLDYRLAPNDRLSFSFTRSTYNTNYDIRGLIFAIERVTPGDFAPTYTHGAAGQGSLTVNTEVRDRSTTTFMPTLTYRHDGPIWKLDAGLGYSHSRDHTQSTDRGFFALSSARRTGVTLAFDDVTAHRPGRLTITEGTTGVPVDPFNISTYTLATVQPPAPYNIDAKRSVQANARRDLNLRGFPLGLKAGVDLQSQTRDNRNDYPANATINCVGRDGRSSTTPVGNDDSAAPFFYSAIADRPGVFGFPAIPVVNTATVLAQYRSNPEQFRLDENAAYRAPITFSKFAEETVSSAYLRADLQGLRHRLKLVGGIRAEQTNVRAQGPLTDPTRNYQRDAAGNIIFGANNRPLPIAPANTLAYSQLTFIDRGATASKEYLRWFPSLNASYTLRDNLIARAAGYTSIGRPNFNQYCGGITLPDTEANPSTSNRITVNNAGIKPWTARTVQLALEYYFSRVGLVSITAHRRNFKNFFGTTVQPVTAEFLALYSLDPNTYGDYDASTQYNITDTVRMDGLSFNYKQALTFLPSWARGVQVFANGSTQHASGGASDNFQYSPRLANVGISLTRTTYSVRIDVNHRGQQQVSTLTGRGIQPDTIRYAVARNSLDVTAEHQVWRMLRFFAKFRNVTDVGVDFEYYGPATPDSARFQQRERYGALWTFGLKGTF